MAKLSRKPIHDLERIIEFDLVRATEAAALNASQWMGKGDKNARTRRRAMRYGGCSIDTVLR